MIRFRHLAEKLGREAAVRCLSCRRRQPDLEGWTGPSLWVVPVGRRLQLPGLMSKVTVSSGGVAITPAT